MGLSRRARSDSALHPQGSVTLDLISASFADNTLTVLLNSPHAPSLNLQSTTANALTLRWSGAWPGFNLQENSDLRTNSWVSVTDSVSVLAGQNQVRIAPATRNNFCRLVHP